MFMWYTITCPDCGKKFTYFTEHDEYTAMYGLYSIVGKHEAEYQHRGSSLERKDIDVEYWIRKNIVRTAEKDPSAYEY